MTVKNTRRTFSREFKLDVINQSEHCEKITDLADELDLTPELIYRWRSEFKSDPEKSFPGRGGEKQISEDQRMAAMERELAEVKKQRDILKNALAIFVKNQ
jgi:transposase